VKHSLIVCDQVHVVLFFIEFYLLGVVFFYFVFCLWWFSSVMCWDLVVFMDESAWIIVIHKVGLIGKSGKTLYLT